MRSLLRWWRVHFLGAELAVALLLAGAFVFWSQALDGWTQLESLLGGRVDSVYSTFATVYAALLGFAIATTAIVAGFSQDERMKLLRRSAHYPTLWRVFMAAVRVLGLATLVSLAALVTDKGDPTRLPLYAVAAVSGLAVLRVLRSIWVLQKMIGVIGKQEEG